MIGKSLYQGDRVELTAIDPEKDAAAFAKWMDRPAVFHRFMPGHFRAVTEGEMKKKLTDTLKKAEERRHSYYFAIRLSEGGDLIGFTCIVWVLHTHQTARFFIDFNKEENLLAHGDETLKLMLRYAFMEVSLHRLATVVSTYETSLILLLERFGFLREVQRREAVFHDGQYFDELDYALLKPEYKKTIEEETK